MGLLKSAKQRISRAKAKIERAKAKSKGMNVREYRAHKQTLKATEKQEKQKFEQWRIKEEYRQKRKQQKKGGGGFLDSLSQMGANFEKNLLGTTSAPPRKRSKKKKKSRKKGRTIVINV